MLYLCSMNATKNPSILIIYTGGTIGMTENPETGALMNFDFDKFQLYVPELKRFPYHIDSYTFNPPIDSSDMEPKYWVKMAQVIAENYDQFDGFVVLMERYQAEGLEALAAELRLLDPEYYAQCDIRNPKRVIHALEICYMTGTTYTSFRVRKKKVRPFRILKIGLQREREDLFDRINRRVTQMVEQGALEEVRRVVPFRTENSLNTVGVKELLNVIDGEWELNFALDRLRKNTRVYAKKQMTWFKKDDTIHWFHPNQEAEILDFVQRELGMK